eukprot:Clim_evm78s172 gene=Clim_evmTU78s172
MAWTDVFPATILIGGAIMATGFGIRAIDWLAGKPIRYARDEWDYQSDRRDQRLTGRKWRQQGLEKIE